MATASIASLLVVELEDRDPAALAVDDAQVGDDAGEQLRLAAVDQVGDALRLAKRRTSAALWSNRWPER